MQKKALGKKDHQAGKKPLSHCFREQQPGKPSGENRGGHPEEYIYQPGGYEKDIKTIGEKIHRAQKITLQYVSEHGLKGIGASVTGNQHSRIISPGKISVFINETDHTETVDFIRTFPEWLKKYKDHHAEKSQGKEKDFMEKLVFIKTTYFSHILLLLINESLVEG